MRQFRSTRLPDARKRRCVVRLSPIRGHVLFPAPNVWGTGAATQLSEPSNYSQARHLQNSDGAVARSRRRNAPASIVVRAVLRERRKVNAYRRDERIFWPGKGQNYSDTLPAVLSIVILCGFTQDFDGLLSILM